MSKTHESIKPLLTIAIPTYNRLKDLQFTLPSLLEQVVKYKSGEVEVIISDNASTDGTYKYLKDLVESGAPIVLYKNSENLGPDANISSCYKYAKGRFLWICSDDDFLARGALEKVIDLLYVHPNIGNCHIKSKWYSGSLIEIPNIKRFTYEINDSKEQFKKLNYWVTFLTANIVNKEKLETEGSVIFPSGTFLIQLGWILPSIFVSNENIIINDELLYCQIKHNRGYTIIPIFCTNLCRLLRQFESKGIGSNLLKDMKEPLLKKFLVNEIDTVVKQKEFVIIPMLKEFFYMRSFWLEYLPKYFKQKSKFLKYA